MSLKRLSVRLFLAIGVAGSAIALLCGTPAKGEKVGDIREANKNLPQLGEVELPATSAQTLVQTAIDPSSVAPDQGGVVSITGVVANPTDKGVEIVLQTTQGKILQPVTLVLGRTYIANIPDAVLALPQGGEFRQDNPANGINRVRVTQATANSIRVAVTGETALPQVQLYDAPNEGLVFSFTPGTSAAQTPPPPEGETQPGKPTVDEQEIVVTDEQDEGYNPSSASTATRTDTPLRDIPQSIQVVPQEVLRDRNVRTVNEAVETVSGVLDGSNSYGAPGGGNIIRGFSVIEAANSLRNGFRDYDCYSVSSIGTIERIEVLKGPASVLFGSLEVGGVINTVTKQPLSEPYYNVAFEAGNYGFYQPSIDLSGPLTTDGNMLYRFITSYQGAGSYIDFVNSNTTTIAPSIALKLGDRTDLNLSYEYVRYVADNPVFEVPLLSDGSLPPRNFYAAYPALAFQEVTTNRIGYTLNHKFSDNWQLRNNLAIVLNERVLDRNGFATLVDDRILTDPFVEESSSYADNYFGQIDLLGKFNTGSISHQLLAGFDANYFETQYKADDATVPDLDIFNPNYNVPKPEYLPGRAFYNATKSYGVYLQDQIAFSDNWKLLIGGRYDWVTNNNKTLRNDIDEPVLNDEAFSPRVGLVYQPSDNVSLYTSYSRSFRQDGGFSSNPDGSGFEPTRGTQYEVGVKTDFLERQLSATLAAYHITKTNVTTPDPNNPEFSIQTGEVRSQGIELDVTGEILPGWKIITSYAYTDAEVTEDNNIPVGNQLDNVPFNQASLWTTYEIQTGNFRGLGFGLGLFYIGGRQGDLDNSFELPSHLRTDAALYYRRDGFNAAINVRNLFDIDYSSYSFGRTFIQRGAPLTITGSVSWEF